MTLTSAELWRHIAPSNVTLADPEPPKNSNALPFADGEQAVDGAHAGDQRFS